MMIIFKCNHQQVVSDPTSEPNEPQRARRDTEVDLKFAPHGCLKFLGVCRRPLRFKLSRSVAGLWVLWVLSVIALFAPLLRGRVPAFRDAYHFYYPLEVWLDQQVQSGVRWPHYNPSDGTGINLLGETSSGLFYPGRVLWSLPVLNVGQRMGLVLCVHVLIAGAGAAYAAARLGLSRQACCLAAMAYSLSTPVFFQHTNPIYLIGAAWTPWALAESLVVARGLRASVAPRWWIWIGAVSLMFLGGDPQASVHAGLVAGVALLSRVAPLRCFKDSARQLSGLLLACVAVIGLTAVQWLPTRYWLQQSQRVAQPMDTDSAHQSLVAQPVPASLIASLGRSSDRRSDGAAKYSYSVAPWHLPTMIWGRGGGALVPDNSRWLQAIPAEPRMWIPSLSIGLLPLLLACGCLCNRRLRRQMRFLWLVTLLSALAMFGNYAPMWALRNMLLWCGATQWVTYLPGDETGGVYWMLTQLVPGYGSFRYPAKWSVWFVCGMTLCAAHGLDNVRRIRGSLERLCQVSSILSAAILLPVVGLILLPATGPLRVALVVWLSNAPSDPWLGPIDFRAVLNGWLIASSLVVALSLVTLFLNRRYKLERSLAIHLLVLIELGSTCSMFLVTTDPQLASSAPEFDLTRRDPNQESSGLSPDSSYQRLWANVGRADFLTMSQPQIESPERSDTASTSGTDSEWRIEALCRFQRQFQLAKLHLLHAQTGNLSAFYSLTPGPLATVRMCLADKDKLNPNDAELDEILAWLGVSQRLVNDQGLAWHKIQNVRPMFEVIQRTDSPPMAANEPSTCICVAWNADLVRLQVNCTAPSTLVSRLYQDGGWSARLSESIEDSAQPVRYLSVGPQQSHLRLFQSLEVPAGEWDVTLTYVAPGYVVGKWISCLSLVVVIALFVLFRIQLRQRKQ